MTLKESNVAMNMLQTFVAIMPSTKNNEKISILSSFHSSNTINLISVNMMTFTET